MSFQLSNIPCQYIRRPFLACIGLVLPYNDPIFNFRFCWSSCPSILPCSRAHLRNRKTNLARSQCRCKCKAMTDTDHRLSLPPVTISRLSVERSWLIKRGPCLFPIWIAKSCRMALPPLPSVAPATICTLRHIIGKSIQCAQAELVRKDAYQIAAIGHDTRSNMALGMLRPSMSASANLDDEARGCTLTQVQHSPFSWKSLQLAGLETRGKTLHPKTAMLVLLCRTTTSFNGTWRALASS